MLKEHRKFPDNIGSKKKFESWGFNITCGKDNLSCKVESCSASRGGRVIGFQAKFPDSHLIYDTDIEKLRDSCEKYAMDSQNWEFEYILRVWVRDEFSLRTKLGEDEASVGIRWQKLKRVKGGVVTAQGIHEIYFREDGHQQIESPQSDSDLRDIYDKQSGFKMESDKVVQLDWTQERENILKSFCKRIREVKSALDEALNQTNIANMLDGMGLARMLGEGKKEINL